MNNSDIKDKHLWVLQQTIETTEKYSQFDKCLLNTEEDLLTSERKKARLPILANSTRNKVGKTASLKSFSNIGDKKFHNLYNMEVGKHNAEIAQKKLMSQSNAIGQKKLSTSVNSIKNKNVFREDKSKIDMNQSDFQGLSKRPLHDSNNRLDNCQSDSGTNNNQLKDSKLSNFVLNDSSLKKAYIEEENPKRQKKKDSRIIKILDTNKDSIHENITDVVSDRGKNNDKILKNSRIEENSYSNQKNINGRDNKQNKKNSVGKQKTDGENLDSIYSKLKETGAPKRKFSHTNFHEPNSSQEKNATNRKISQENLSTKIIGKKSFSLANVHQNEQADAYKAKKLSKDKSKNAFGNIQKIGKEEQNMLKNKNNFFDPFNENLNETQVQLYQGKKSTNRKIRELSKNSSRNFNLMSERDLSPSNLEHSKPRKMMTKSGNYFKNPQFAKTLTQRKMTSAEMPEDNIAKSLMSNTSANFYKNRFRNMDNLGSVLGNYTSTKSLKPIGVSNNSVMVKDSKIQSMIMNNPEFNTFLNQEENLYEAFSTFVMKNDGDYTNNMDCLNNNDLRTHYGEAMENYNLINDNPVDIDVNWNQSNYDEVKPAKFWLKNKSPTFIQLGEYSYTRCRIRTESVQFPATFHYNVKAENFKNLETYIGFNYDPNKLKYDFKNTEASFIVDASKSEQEDMIWMGILIIATKFFQSELVVSMSGILKFIAPKLQQIIESAPAVTKNVKFNNELERMKMNNADLLKFEGNYDIDPAILQRDKVAAVLRIKTIKKNIKNVDAFKETRLGIYQAAAQIKKEKINQSNSRKQKLHGEKMQRQHQMMNRNCSIKDEREKMLETTIYSLLRLTKIKAWMYFIKVYQGIKILDEYNIARRKQKQMKDRYYAVTWLLAKFAKKIKRSAHSKEVGDLKMTKLAMQGIAIHVRQKIYRNIYKTAGKFFSKICEILKFKKYMNEYITGVEIIKVRWRAHMRTRNYYKNKFVQSFNDQHKFMLDIENKMGKPKPEFELSLSKSRFTKGLQNSIFITYWNQEMRTHMTNVIEKRIKTRALEKQKKIVRNTLNLKDANPNQFQKEENKCFGYSFKNLIKEWKSFEKFFENKDPVLNILAETKEKVETEYIECHLKAIKNTGDSSIGTKKKNIFRMAGKIAKDFTSESEIHRDMMAKFKLKFEKSSVFRGIVEIMRENEQTRFRPKFDRTWMRSLIVTIHQDVILGKLTEFTQTKTIKKRAKVDQDNTNEDGTSKRMDLVDFKDQVKLDNSKRNIMLNKEAEKARRATVYEERKNKQKEEEDQENKKNTQGDKNDKEITSKKEEEKTSKESTKATEETQKQENQKS